MINRTIKYYVSEITCYGEFSPYLTIQSYSILTLKKIDINYYSGIRLNANYKYLSCFIFKNRINKKSPYKNLTISLKLIKASQNIFFIIIITQI